MVSIGVAGLRGGMSAVFDVGLCVSSRACSRFSFVSTHHNAVSAAFASVLLTPAADEVLRREFIALRFCTVHTIRFRCGHR